MKRFVRGGNRFMMHEGVPKRVTPQPRIARYVPPGVRLGKERQDKKSAMP
jgi:hypothetical protein